MQAATVSALVLRGILASEQLGMKPFEVRYSASTRAWRLR